MNKFTHGQPATPVLRPPDAMVRLHTSGPVPRIVTLVVMVCLPLLAGCYSTGRPEFAGGFQIHPLVTWRPANADSAPQAEPFHDPGDAGDRGHTGERRYDRTSQRPDRNVNRSVQPAAWQDTAAELPPPAARQRFPENERSPSGPAANRQIGTDTLPRQDLNTGFVADEMARSLPQSATERVIELKGEVAMLRDELLQLRQLVEKVQHENQDLQGERTRLNERLAMLERQLESTRQEEQTMRTRFEELNQRLRQFNARRLEQIANLNQMIDQLELQLRDPQTPRTAVPAAATSNPYRNATTAPGGSHP